MQLKQNEFRITADGVLPQKASLIFAAEWEKRLGFRPQTADTTTQFIFTIENESKDESYTVTAEGECVRICAHRLRGLIYGIGRILRNLSLYDGIPVLSDDAFGLFAPDMPVRGHGIGYTDMSNSYEAWNEAQFRQYILDLMYFGMNTVETSYAVGEQRTKLMQYEIRDALVMISGLCEELDVDLTVWQSLSKSKTDEETIDEMMQMCGDMPKITSLFLPGGDPGDLLPEDFIARCRKIRQALSIRFPGLQLLPSAQAPHEYPDWKDRFVKVMDTMPAEVDGIIYGPNHAMPLDELRRTIDKRYPLQHYPDICHNVRCETPVHFPQDDWHFAWGATLSRESVNPRPTEYRLLHRKMRSYVDGQTSYSEGVNDDVNKAVWSGLDFDFYAEPRTLLREYTRLYCFGADADLLADGIFGLEQNWNCDPAESMSVEPTYRLFCELKETYPQLQDNWRFMLLYFRACCDKTVRDRRLFELSLLHKAEKAVLADRLDEAKCILETDFDEKYKKLRDSLFDAADILFRQIKIQLDVAHFGGMSWERGCTLETIDMPVTDRLYFLHKLEQGTARDDLLRLFNRGRVAKDEYYFSFALHGFDVCGRQEGEFYIDFRGDRNGDASLPMCMLKNYDHFVFRTQAAGLTAGNYRLRITYKDRNHDGIDRHRVCINGHCIFEGNGFGGTRDVAYESLFLADGYQSIVYEIDESQLVNGCAELEISEPTVGFVMSEILFEKAV